MEVCTATTFLRHDRPLRAVLLDNQPWFVACELARLMGLNYPHSLAHRMERHEVRQIQLLHPGGNQESVEVISEPALYKAFARHSHPENRTLARWLNESVIPQLRDQAPTHPEHPRRQFMSWRRQRVTVLSWQGELWVPLQQLPTFSDAAEGGSSPRGFWRR